MKCITATRDTKTHKKGEIVRIGDKEANERVDTGYWAFISKSEWKKVIRVPKQEEEKKVEKKSKKVKK